MSRGLNYHHLHCFWTIAEEGSISRAAKQLHVTHSTLSVQLRALEETLGGALFERRGRGLVITPLGDEVRAHARDIFRIGRELLDVSARGSGGRVTVRVGALATLPRTITCRLLEPALGAGTFAIDVQHGPFDRVLEELAAGRIHVVLADQAPPQGSADCLTKSGHYSPSPGLIGEGRRELERPLIQGKRSVRPRRRRSHRRSASLRSRGRGRP